MSNLILGGILGLLMGLAWCYWKQIQAVYQNRDLISSGSDLYTSAQNFWGELKKY
jgi:predicted negative regulator of RcsB-dependent stress response